MKRNEPLHDKTNKMKCVPSEDSDQPGHQSLPSAWRNTGSLDTHWGHSEDSNQTGQMHRLICLCWAHMPFCWFCHAAAQISNCKIWWFFMHSTFQHKRIQTVAHKPLPLYYTVHYTPVLLQHGSKFDPPNRVTMSWYFFSYMNYTSISFLTKTNWNNNKSKICVLLNTDNLSMLIYNAIQKLKLEVTITCMQNNSVLIELHV